MILIEPPRSPTVAAGANGTVSILLTSDDRIRELNRQFRRKNSATDVLSFPAPEPLDGRRGRNAGDLAISLDMAARQASALGHSLADEVKVLILHGALHLAGFDHEADSGEMARLEKRLRKKFELPSGLIQRAADTKPRVRKGARS
jgi:probable rRNA maturation factor